MPSSFFTMIEFPSVLGMMISLLSSWNSKAANTVRSNGIAVGIGNRAPYGGWRGALARNRRRLGCVRKVGCGYWVIKDHCGKSQRLCVMDRQLRASASPRETNWRRYGSCGVPSQCSFFGKDSTEISVDSAKSQRLCVMEGETK